VRIFCKGEPVTFATRAEHLWKEALARAIPVATSDSKGYIGVSLRFVVSSLKHNGHSFDLDNLTEPVFSVLVNKKGYFEGRRPSIMWWKAEKRVDTPAGVEILLHRSVPSVHFKGMKVFEGHYTGPLPESAKDRTLSNWLLSKVAKSVSSDGMFSVYLSFPEKTNIADIATGPVKSTIDCLWPLIGGQPGAPEDWRVEELVVEKTKGLTGEKVRIEIWSG
jgi:hypothetical protein